MTETLPDPVARILERAPHAAAFGRLCALLDALPPTEAATVADRLAPRLHDWPAETRSLDVRAEASPGPAALRLARRLTVVCPSAADAGALSRLASAMPLLDGITFFMPSGDGALPALLRVVPTSLRSLAFEASPGRQVATKWADEVGSALGRFEGLDSVALGVGHASSRLLERLAGRPLVSFSTRLANVEDPRVLRGLDGRSLRELHLHATDGVPATWTGEELRGLVAPLVALEELTLPWLDATVARSLGPLRRLAVSHVTGDAGAAIDALPEGLRALRAGGIPADATLPAFTRCPALSEISWVGQPLSRAGIETFLASGALARITKLELNGALGGEGACVLFARGVPERLRVLDLFGMDLGDWATAPLAASPSPWLDGLEELQIPMNGLSDRALAALLDRLVEDAPGLVVVSVAGNRVGAASFARLARLEARGVAIDQVIPAPKSTSARGASASSAAAAVRSAWTRIDAFLSARAIVIPGIGPPAAKERLDRASLPPSLAALHAQHDGIDGNAEVLGLGNVAWWPLDEGEGGPSLIAIADRRFVAFGAPIDDDAGELPEPDDDLDEVLAIDVETEEVVAIDLQRDLVTTLEEHLGVALERVGVALEAGTHVIDENGRLRPAAPPAPSPEVVSRATAVTDLARMLVKNAVVELRDGATEAELSSALADALRSKTKKARVAAVLAVFEDNPLVDEVFADEEQLLQIAEALA
jgi:hypothetical protein